MALRSIWQTLADPTRLRLLALLAKEEVSVAELQQILHLGQSRISTHLSVLRVARLVEPRREGKRTYYSLTKKLDRETRQLLDAAWLTLAEVPEAKQDATTLSMVLEKRRQEARDYFNRIAGRLGKSFCPGRTWSEVGPMLAQMIPHVDVADLGAGEGWLSQLMAQNAKKVIAVDNSPKMVAFGRQEARKKRLPNLEYRLGDLENPPLSPSSIDIAVLSQALHHAVRPAVAIEAVAKILRPGGKIIILDLNEHHFDRARLLYGDYWLGFSEVDLTAWLKEAGFHKIRIQLLPADEQSPNLQPLLATAEKLKKS